MILSPVDILRVEPLTGYGKPVEIIRLFGGKDAYLAAIRDLEYALYSEAASWSLTEARRHRGRKWTKMQ